MTTVDDGNELLDHQLPWSAWRESVAPALEFMEKLLTPTLKRCPQCGITYLGKDFK